VTSRSSLPALRTERLALRPVVETDLGLLIELNSDPEVMAFIRGRAATPSETTSEWYDRLTHRSDPARGMGYWLGFLDEAFVGWWSASFFAACPEISGIGYRLRRAGWGRGLATEGARAMVLQAFADPDVASVFASTRATNVGSRRVLEKVGMTHTSTWMEAHEDANLGSEHRDVRYELTRTDWEGLAGP
jgi:RimJ/RimL family protein N-acetyltransferase